RNNMLHILKCRTVLLIFSVSGLCFLLVACDKVPEKIYLSTDDYYIDLYHKNLLTKREIFYKEGEKIIMNFANGKFINSKHYNNKHLLVEYFAKNDSICNSTIYFDSIKLHGEGQIDY